VLEEHGMSPEQITALASALVTILVCVARIILLFQASKKTQDGG
jgi:hypothetical protein